MAVKAGRHAKGLFYNERTKNWEIRIKYAGKNREKVIGPDKRIAQLQLDKVRNEIREAKLSGQGWTGFDKFKRDSPRTFGDAAATYMDERAKHKQSTVSSYTSILNAYLLPAFENTPLRDISSNRLKVFKVQLQKLEKPNGKAPLSESRINTIMQLLRSILKQEEMEGRLDRDPSRAVPRLQEPKTKIDPLSDEELDLVLSCVSKHFRPFFIAQAFTGARPNELQALRWSDIDWKSKQIQITKGRVRGKEGLPKTAAGDRLVPMVPQVESALHDLKCSSVVSLDDYVFLNKAGKPIDKHLDEVWRRALKKAGLRHRPSYQLRHTFVTRCILHQMPLPYIAKVIGHSTIDTLVRHYAGWIDKATTQYDQKLRDSFGPADPVLRTESEHSIKGGVKAG